MKRFNTPKIYDFIDKNKDYIEEASIGMYEDWFWTAENIWEDGTYIRSVEDVHLQKSRWATPSLMLIYLDETTKFFDVSIGQQKPETILHDSMAIQQGQGCISKPIQETMPDLEDIKEPEIRTCYRIVEVKNNEYHSLFHGTNRSRKLETGKWLRANKKTVKDGSCSTYYQSGWHVMKTKKATQEFFDKMFRIKKDRIIIPVKVRTDALRPKSHARGELYLVDEMLIEEKL